MIGELRIIERDGVRFTAQAVHEGRALRGGDYVTWRNVSARRVRTEERTDRGLHVRIRTEDGSPLNGSMSAEKWRRLPLGN